jgi:muramoyltetrapeptide carboxypeptidase
MVNKAFDHPLFQRIFQSRTIKLIAPASGAPAEVIEQLRTLPGLNLEIPTSLMTEDILFHASSDEHRFEQLRAALYDDSSDVILWTLRGGYGSARLLDRLHALLPPKQAKIVIGFSDNTALHLFLSQCWHWKTIHGSGLAQLLDLNADPSNFIRIAEWLETGSTQQTLTHLKPLNHLARKVDRVIGFMQGGNLTIIESSIGTFWEIKTAGSILFIEEIGEKGYRIDRSLNHLRQAGLLTKVHAIIFGECTGADEVGIGVAIERFAQETAIPVYQTDQFGHGVKNYPLIYQAKAEIIPMSPSDDYKLTMYV